LTLGNGIHLKTIIPYDLYDCAFIPLLIMLYKKREEMDDQGGTPHEDRKVEPYSKRIHQNIQKKEAKIDREKCEQMNIHPGKLFVDCHVLIVSIHYSSFALSTE
jgi:hypothetical protein